MKHVKLWDIKSNIDKYQNIYAHTKDKAQNETLLEHLDKTIYYLFDLMDKKGLDKILNSIIENICIKGKPIEKEYTDLIKELYINAIYLHDIGKINPAFQRKLGNTNIDTFEDTNINNSDHSLLSALIYIDIYRKPLENIKNSTIKRFIHYTIYTFAYIISKHHSQLGDMTEFLNKLNNLQQNEVQQYPQYLHYYKDKSILNRTFKEDAFANRDQLMPGFLKDGELNWYILNKLLYALITGCDFYATYSYSTSYTVNYGIIQDIDSLVDAYKSTDIYKSIEKYKTSPAQCKDNSINALRTELFIEAENNLLENMKSNLFYLEAPTGSGKTNSSINIALNTIKNNTEYNKIFYIFPFNTLVEQTKKSLDTIFAGSNAKTAVINSITPIMQEDEDEADKNIYQKYLIDRQFLHYPIVLTTHVNFFKYLFGTDREASFPLLHLCNSVVIMDEIQSYKNHIWMEIVMFLERYSKLLNIKLIIMSATLPKLDKLIKYDHEVFVELIKNRSKYYEHEFFKNRVQLDYSLLKEGRLEVQTLLEKISEIIEINGSKRYLIEFISKGSANKFFKNLKEKHPQMNIKILTGDDSILERNKILKELNAKYDTKEYICKNIILVATQIIEAGVDIDMDIGFKDISMLDNEEQFLGRINRSCAKTGCKAYFFDLDDAAKIYHNDYRLEKNLYDEAYRSYLENKSFENHYNRCFARIEEEKKKCNASNINDMLKEVLALDFNKIEQRMKLIDQEYYRLFLDCDIKLDEDEKVIRGHEVWEQYKNLVYDREMGYAEKMVKLTIINEKMNCFLYNYAPMENGEVYTKRNKPQIYNEAVGNIYYVPNGYDYITDGRFDREKYREESESDSW